MSVTRSAMKNEPVGRSTSLMQPFVWEGTDKRGVKMKGEQDARKDGERQRQAQQADAERRRVAAQRGEGDMGEGELAGESRQQRPARGEQRIIPGNGADMRPVRPDAEGREQGDEEQQRLRGAGEGEMLHRPAYSSRRCERPNRPVGLTSSVTIRSSAPNACV